MILDSTPATASYYQSKPGTKTFTLYLIHLGVSLSSFIKFTQLLPVGDKSVASN